MCVEPDPRRGISFSLVPYASSTGRFTTQWHRDQVVVIAAGGDHDATNAGCFVEYALRHIDEKHALVLDLRKLEFLGTEGFLALKTAWSYAHQRAIDCTLLTSAAVDRLLEIGDPECTVSTADSLREVLNRLALPPASNSDNYESAMGPPRLAG